MEVARAGTVHLAYRRPWLGSRIDLCTRHPLPRPAPRAPKGEPIESNPYDETCAVILTTATLTQASSSKDATPEDFKLHQLHTSGTASGTNKIISYVSLKTGLVVRTTEDAHQTMSVTIAKADKSNRVHYDVSMPRRYQSGNSPHRTTSSLTSRGPCHGSLSQRDAIFSSSRIIEDSARTTLSM